MEKARAILRSSAAVAAVLAFGLPGAALGDGLVAELSYPTAGATVTDLTRPFRWTAIPSAQSYFVVIGTAAGQANVWMSGDVVATSVMAPANLPKGPRLYARLWTKAEGILKHSSDVPFTVTDPPQWPKVVAGPRVTPISRAARESVLSSPSMVSMVYPDSGDPDVNFDEPFTWTTVAGAQAYELFVGTSPGRGDVFDSGQTPRTSLTLAPFPAGSYYGRIATNVAGQWGFNDFVFGSTGQPAATIRSPASGSVLDAGQTVFSWNAVPNADSYRFVVGTTSGGSDVADSGVITERSFEISSPPAIGTLYVRLFTSKWNVWRFTDAVFFTSASHPTLVTPVDGASSVDTGFPFEWQSSGPPSSFRLEIGTRPGANDLLDTGEIWVTKRFVPPLPTDQTLYGRLSQHSGDSWVPLDFHFTVGVNGPTNPHVVAAALWATDFVRGMANEVNVPFPNTALANLLAAEGLAGAACNDYANTLLFALQEMNVSSPTRIRNLCLKPNLYDCHTLVELQEPGETWMLLDPTFDLTARRSSDGQWATAADISNATRTMNFSDITYQFLGERGNSVAKSYYLDYPLLYLVACGSDGLDECPDPYPSSLPYMEAVPLPVRSSGLYAIQAAPGGSTSATVDGAEVQISCDPVDGLSYIFAAQTIDLAPGFSIRVFRPRRFVF